MKHSVVDQSPPISAKVFALRYPVRPISLKPSITALRVGMSGSRFELEVPSAAKKKPSGTPQDQSAAPNAGAPAGMPFDPAMIEKFNENCFVRGGFAAVMGVPLGFFFAALGTSSSNLDPDMPTRKAVIEGFKEMGRTGYRNAKTFALIGGLWSTTECFIEKYRAKNDMWNGITGGCVTGVMLAARTGSPQAMGAGCVGMAAFGFAMDWLFRTALGM